MFRTLYGKLATALLALFLVVAGFLALTVRHMPTADLAQFGGEVLFGGLVFSLLAGLMLFRSLTRRLSLLAAAMERLQASNFIGRIPAAPASERERDGGDEIDRLGAAFHDMAERIVEQVQALRESEKLQRELVANVSHDLRTPLAALRGYLETLLLKESSLAPEERRNYLEIAAKQSERLGRLVGELFDLTTLDTGKLTLTRETFPVDELIQDVVQKYQPSAERKGIRLEGDFPPAAPLVSADIGLVERVLENLIENALRHTPAGGRITVRLAATAAAACVEVRDSGPGIPPQELPHLFERFYRGEESREKTSGAGLGLAIAKRIVELHRGRMRVESEPGHGAAFTFCLPIDVRREAELDRGGGGRRT